MATTSAQSLSLSSARSLTRTFIPFCPSKSTHFFCRRLCQVSVDAKPSYVVKGVANVNQAESFKNIMNLAQRAGTKREILHTGFVTPNISKEVMLAVEKLSHVKAISQGGYPEAQRTRISVGHVDILTKNPNIIGAVSIRGNFKFGPCSEEDFLGAILGAGIKGDAVGDILIQGEKGAQVLIKPEMIGFLISRVDTVKNVWVTCTEIPLLALKYEPPRTKMFTTVEASVRLDALASAGFKISRSKLVDQISSGDVKVNWSPVTKNGSTLKTGDVVSISVQGRLEIGEIKDTRKGKYSIELIRYF